MTLALCDLPPEKNRFMQRAWLDIFEAIGKNEFSFFPNAFSQQDAALLMPRAALNNKISQHRLETPRMRLVTEGKEIDSEKFIPFPDFSFPSALTKEGPSEQELRTCYFSWTPKVFPVIFHEEQDISFEIDLRKWVFSKKVLPFFELMRQGGCSFAQARSSLDDAINDGMMTEFLKALILQGLLRAVTCHT